MCGHELAEECRAVANEFPEPARERCPHCRDDCVPTLQVLRYPHEPRPAAAPLPLH